MNTSVNSGGGVEMVTIHTTSFVHSNLSEILFLLILSLMVTLCFIIQQLRLTRFELQALRCSTPDIQTRTVQNKTYYNRSKNDTADF